MRSTTPARIRRTSPLGSPAHESLPAERMVFTEADLASRWGMSPKTLQRWRTEGRGPHYLKLGKRVTYTVNAIEAYENFVQHISTSQRVAS